MFFFRRHLLSALAALVGLSAAIVGHAQSFPSKSVRLVIPSSAGTRLTSSPGLSLRVWLLTWDSLWS